MRNKLKQTRIENELTQVDVAKLIDISVRQYQHLEAGTRNTTPEKWDKLEDLLGVPQRQLRETE